MKGVVKCQFSLRVKLPLHYNCLKTSEPQYGSLTSTSTAPHNKRVDFYHYSDTI